MGAAVHPAVHAMKERVYGIEWHYELRDFNNQLDVCGVSKATGRRHAATIYIDLDSVHRGMIAEIVAMLPCYEHRVAAAKKLILEALSKPNVGDAVLEGSETPINFLESKP